MPIEINEVVIRVSVEEPKASTQDAAPAPATAAKSSDEVVEQILQILREKQER